MTRLVYYLGHQHKNRMVSPQIEQSTEFVDCGSKTLNEQLKTLIELYTSHIMIPGVLSDLNGGERLTQPEIVIPAIETLLSTVYGHFGPFGYGGILVPSMYYFL